MTSISELSQPADLHHGLGSVWTAARLANPDLAAGAPATFHAGAVFRVSAEAWRDTLFFPVLLPAFRAALLHARNGEFRELTAVDAALSAQLGSVLNAASQAAGRRLAGCGSQLRGDRLWPRLVEAVDSSRTPGHLSTLFAARCAAFSLADRTAVGAYLFQELCLGAPRASVEDACEFIVSCLEPLGSLDIGLRAA